jgi:hypothetical protein
MRGRVVMPFGPTAACFLGVPRAWPVPFPSRPTLGGLSRLETLNLWDCKITDVGVKQLSSLTQRRGIRLPQQTVSAHALQDLQDSISVLRYNSW